MKYRYYCVIATNGIYRAYVRAKIEQDEGEEMVETVLGYKLAEGERLIDAEPPTRKAHAGNPGFVRPRWDEDAAAWFEGATAEELTAWEAEHPDPVSLEEKRAAKHAEVSTASEAAIYAGMDVETTQGTEHFSLEKNDQINLTTAVNAVQ